MPDLWSHIDLSVTRRKISVDQISAYIKRSRGKVRTVILSGSSGFAPSRAVVLRCIANRCRALSHLQICHGIVCHSILEATPAFGSLESLIIGAEIGLDFVTQILELCSRLKRAEFADVTAAHPAKWAGDLSQLQTLIIDAKRTVHFGLDMLRLVSLDKALFLSRTD